MRVGSLFSGIEGFGLGFEKAGWEIAWQVEQDTFCLAVLKTHWPSVQRFTDVRRVGKANLAKVDCITAGVPCQDVSIAGRRDGLAGKRTGLFYEFARILQELRPTWFVFENVPGLFSSNEGRDFAEILRVLMVECGYGVCWRVLDSRYFNVAQRRERVFIVGRLGAPCPAEILFEPASGARNTQASGEARKDIAVPLTSGSGESLPGRRMEDDWNIVSCLDASPYADREAEHTRLVAQNVESGGRMVPLDVAASLRASDGHHGRSSPRGDGSDNIIAIQDVRGGTRDSTDAGQGIGIRESDQMYTLSKTEQHAVAYPLRGNERNNSDGRSVNLAYALREDPGGTGQAHNCTYVINEERSGVEQHTEGKVDGTVQRNVDDGTTADSHGVRTASSISYRLDVPRKRVIVSGEELRKMWCAICSKKKAIWHNASHLRLQKTTLLQRGLCADCFDKTESFCRSWQEMGAAAYRSEEVCALPGDYGFDSRSQRRESLEQCPGERSSPLPELSHERGMEARKVPERWTVEACACPDSPRYRALGNAVTVSVAAWIARRMRACIEND